MNLQDCIDIIKNCTTLACEYHIKDKCQYGYEVRENRFECAKTLAIDALEKQIAKKIFHEGYEHEGKMIYPIGINGVPYDLCPSCKTNLCTDGFFGRDKKNLNYCEKCGQKLDWSEV